MDTTTNIKFDIENNRTEVTTKPAKYSTDELFAVFDKLNYKAFGHGAIMLWKINGETKWNAGLRNNQDWKDEKPDTTGATANEALTKLYDYCIDKKYLPV